ncbi:hypothetical protein D3OALGA1CA_3411 [Olavius algarvensis associated proteobacterium Delta 3]|nr:hypothetical protein D3OALGB2SA_769 [Olavius algarvensis associated proteobacterium Delta 3]CAB5133947.1 hypothetical protein D3OALGA1CA_3411 [Olavius algarvensis associated proteobacterium Delta 3]
MNKIKEKQADQRMRIQNPSSKELRGHQSVRATFRLSEACINAISILSAQLGIKQKSVFDHLLEDAQVLKSMANELGSTIFDDHERIRKTFVISRRSLSYLDTISREYKAPRDALVEFSIRRLFPIVTSERRKHEKRKELLSDISNHVADGEKLLSKAAKMVGKNDPVVYKLKSVISAYKNVLDDIGSFIERGKRLESFDSD